ncbi:hypothetical protein KCU94_g124, partial [Aureobasidium melanogenum]
MRAIGFIFTPYSWRVASLASSPESCIASAHVLTETVCLHRCLPFINTLCRRALPVPAGKQWFLWSLLPKKTLTLLLEYWSSFPEPKAMPAVVFVLSNPFSCKDLKTMAHTRQTLWSRAIQLNTNSGEDSYKLGAQYRHITAKPTCPTNLTYLPTLATTLPLDGGALARTSLAQYWH